MVRTGKRQWWWSWLDSRSLEGIPLTQSFQRWDSICLVDRKCMMLTPRWGCSTRCRIILLARGCWCTHDLMGRECLPGLLKERQRRLHELHRRHWSILRTQIHFHKSVFQLTACLCFRSSSHRRKESSQWLGQLHLDSRHRFPPGTQLAQRFVADSKTQLGSLEPWMFQLDSSILEDTPDL